MWLKSKIKFLFTVKLPIVAYTLWHPKYRWSVVDSRPEYKGETIGWAHKCYWWEATIDLIRETKNAQPGTTVYLKIVK